MYKLLDFVSRAEVAPKNFVFTGKDSPWEVVMDLDAVRSRINVDYFRASPPYVSKYLPFLPIKDFGAFVSLKEGATPLMQSKSLSKQFNVDLYFKLEAKNPTGSFKDRGSAVDLTIAKELGAKGITVASTGNMAASCSCYAAAAKIPCFVFVPEDTPPSKLAQVIAYGGHIVQVKGSYNDAASLAQEVAEHLGFFLAGDYAFRVEGQKTAAFELVDQFLYHVPSAVIMPIGCGTNIAAYAKGFFEYQQLGFIEAVPQLIGAQAEGASSVVQSFQKGLKTITKLESVNTIATAIAIANPIDGLKALSALHQTGGQAVMVSDEEALQAQYLLAKEEGLFVECSSATSLAVLQKLLKTQAQSLAGKKIICILTGDGLKDPNPLLKVAIKPPTIYPDFTEFLGLYESSFFERPTIVFVNKEQVIFSAEPTEKQINAALQKHFPGPYSGEEITKVSTMIAKFLKKGKPITFSDFQDIVQEELEAISIKKGDVFSVLDFEVRTAKDVPPVAKITLQINGEVLTSEATGVGPVDAIVNAMRLAGRDKIVFSLVGYKVDIRSQGTDAVVYVELKLIKDKAVSVGRGTSPDIIQASIEAFEEAYNGFY